MTRRKSYARLPDGPNGPTWRYRTVYGKISERDFSDQVAHIGHLAQKIIDAARVQHAASRPLTIERVGDLLDRFLAYLEARGDGRAAQPVTEADVRAFLTRYEGRSYYTRLSTLRAILRRAFPNLRLRTPPKLAGRSTVVPALTSEDVRQIVDAAARDATTYWNEFCLVRSPEAPILMQTVYQFASTNGGLLPSPTSSREYRKFYSREQYHSAQRGEVRHGTTWHRWLYATVDSLLPFVILVTYKLAGNVQSVLEMGADACKAIDDPIKGSRYEVRFMKHRARRELSYRVLSRGATSVPVLLDRVKSMTAPLRSFLGAEDLNRLFVVLVLSGKGTRRCRAMIRSDVKSDVLQRFVARHKLVGADGAPLTFTLQQLRPTRAVDDFLKHHDVFRSKALLNKASLDDTSAYLNQLAVLRRGHELIADMQLALAQSVQAFTAHGDAPAEFPPARAAERDCADPNAPPASGSKGLCQNFLWPLNAAELVIPHEPKYLAELLRERASLSMARQNLLPRRYETQYSERARVVEDHIAGFDRALLPAARELLSTLPPPMDLT